VQQNLRIAMESLSRDIRMAGFMVPVDALAVADRTPIRSIDNGTTGLTQPLPAPDDVKSDILVLNTVSATGIVGVMAIPFPGGVLGVSAVQIGIAPFALDSDASVNSFKLGDNVRIIDPQTYDQPTNALKTVISTVFRVTSLATPTMTLVKESGVDPSGTIFARGDVVARVDKSSNNPNTVKYLLTTGGNCPTGQTCLSRVTDEGTLAQDTQVIATNIAGLQFKYLLDNDTTEYDTVTTLNMSGIRAVKVTLTGQTSATKSISGGAKTRQIVSIIRIRNRPENL